MTNKEVLQIIKKAKEEEKTFLSLYNRNLEELPPEILQLTNLGELSLNTNQLTKLPPEIVQMTNLQILSLGGNLLTKLPPEIVQMTNLQILSLDGNLLTQLPPEIGQLINLRSLSLGGNQLTELPPEIVQLTNLKTLYLDGNQLTELPPEIVQLTNLKELYLARNQLTKLLPKIVQLINLQKLYLARNQLTELPLEIIQLINLKELYLDGNQLTKLPPEIVQLVNLQKLYLDGNQLTELPPEIVQLTNLRSLSLAQNQLTKLPPEIVQLTNLKTLSLDGNQLTELPPEIVQLINLEELYLGGNDKLFEKIPKHFLVEIGNPIKILSHYFQIDESLFKKYRNTPEKLIEIIKRKENKPEENKPLLEGRIIIIGQGNAGKTSLKQRLLPNLEYQNKGKTEGIEINPWELKINNQTVKLNVWDFGGQEIYHTTHQFFFRERCLYLLVVDVRAGMEKIICKYWLRQIKELAKDNAPLILIANKAELHEPESNQEHNDNGLDKRYYASVEDRLNEFKAIYKNIKNIHFVSAEVPLNIEEVKKEIAEAIKTDLPEVFYKYEPEYALTKDIISSQVEDFIAKNKLRELISQRNFDEKFKQPEGQRDLVRVLDTLGTITHFEGDELEDLYILKPEWITKGVYKILSSYKLNETKGKPTINEVKDILNNTKYQGKEKYIIQLMKKFSLCFVKTETGEEKLIFPAWLPIEEPTFSPFVRNISQFEYQYKRDSSVEKFITIFIVDKSQTNDINTYWRHGVVLRENNCRALVKADTEAEKITIIVEGETTARKMFLENIKNYFSILHEKFNNPVQKEKAFEPEKALETIKPENGFDAVQIRENYEELQTQLETLEKDRQNKDEILKLTNEKAEQEAIKQKIDGEAETIASFFIFFIVIIVLLIISYIVYWCIQNWKEVVNPNAQSFLAIAAVVIAVLAFVYYLIRRKMPSEEKIHDIFENKIKNYLYSKHEDFDIREFNKLCEELSRLKETG